MPDRVILRKWYLIHPCLTFSIIRYVSGVKGSNPDKGGAPLLHVGLMVIWKGSIRVALDYRHQVYFYIYIYMILSLSTCQRTRQNVFEYLLSNNLKIRKESRNSSLEEKAYNATTAPSSEREKGKKKKKNQQKRILPSTPVDRRPQSYLKYQ